MSIATKLNMAVSQFKMGRLSASMKFVLLAACTCIVVRVAMRKPVPYQGAEDFRNTKNDGGTHEDQRLVSVITQLKANLPEIQAQTKELRQKLEQIAALEGALPESLLSTPPALADAMNADAPMFARAPSADASPEVLYASGVCTKSLVEENPPLKFDRNDPYQCRQAEISLIHIPKSGGSSIENAGFSKGLLWGFLYEKPRFRKLRMENIPVESSVPNCVGGFSQKGKCCSLWHIPPMWVHDGRPHYRAPVRFCAVRDPYSRVLSEYSFRHGRQTRAKTCNQLNRTQVNVWLRDQMTTYISGSVGLDDCHWIPQHAYVQQGLGVHGAKRALGDLTLGFGRSFEKPGPDRACNYVIKMETLSSDFPLVMKKAGLSRIKLPTKREFTSNCKLSPTLPPKTDYS